MVQAAEDVGHGTVRSVEQHLGEPRGAVGLREAMHLDTRLVGRYLQVGDPAMRRGVGVG